MVIDACARVWQGACDANMMAYAQLEVMAMLPSLAIAKLRNPVALDEADLKVLQP